MSGCCAEAVDKCPGETLLTGRAAIRPCRTYRGASSRPSCPEFPTFNAVLKFGPALAAGNSVVLKPSEFSSSSAIRIAQLALEAGLPPGTLNVVVGVGNIVGRALAEHMDVDMLAFTGSTAVGKLMLQYSALSNLKVIAVECGGKSPQIVFDDCHNVEEVALAVPFPIMLNQGQVCNWLPPAGPLISRRRAGRSNRQAHADL